MGIPELAFLYNYQCIAECPALFTEISGVCVGCEKPCAQCHGSPTRCVTCDGEYKYFFNDMCFKGCPENTVFVPTDDQTKLLCLSCADETCKKCDTNNNDVCLLCKQDLLVHEGKCVSQCPSGFLPNKTNTVCQKFTINDIDIFPFPFLIAASVGCLIAVFGLCKKKAGRTKYISTQNTITCIIVILAPLQFLALIAMSIWAGLFGTTKICYASLALIVCLIILNFVFFYAYQQLFAVMKTP